MRWVLLNEAAAFLTIVALFPGMIDPENDAVEWFMFVPFFVVMSAVWWMYVLVSPIALLILYLMGDLGGGVWSSAWPWRMFRPRS